MTLRITKDDAYQRGFTAGKAGGFFSKDVVADIESYFPGWKQEFPLSAHLDYGAEIVKLWKERLDADLDLTKYPECRGLREIVHAEHQGYLDATGGNERAAAYHYNWSYYLRLRLSTRYFGFADDQTGKPSRYLAGASAGVRAECTAIWFQDTPDGHVMGKNLDTSPRQIIGRQIPCALPGAGVAGVSLAGTATACMFCDEEPDDIFPVNIDYILPQDIKRVRDYVPFRYRYRQFCGPGNGVYVDETGDSVAIEQTNCRMGWRYAEGGVSAVTGLAYQTPELRALKAERDQLSLDKRGWGHGAPDWVYWKRCNARYDRLMRLVADESRRGPTLEGMARILLDSEGGSGARISAANEQFHPDVQTDFWTMCTWVAVPFGPKRRTYRWSQTQPPKGPIFSHDPELVLDESAQNRPEFEDQRQRLARIGKENAPLRSVGGA
jgi:hypothetical protein